MIKYKSLPLYETCTLNYEIRRNKNPIKINEYRDACHINRSVMHAGNLWDSIKKGFNKVKNVFKKGMDFIDNNEVTKSLKDSALNYLGQKTGVDMNKIYDTAHKVIDVIPDVQETNPDPYNYNQYPNSYNYNSNYTYPYNTTGYNNAYNYTSPSTYNYTPASTNYTNDRRSYVDTTGYNNAYNYTPSTPSTQNNSSLQNQFTNTYNQIMKQPLTAPQKQTVQSNYNRFSMGLKSCGMVDVNRFLKNKTFMRNIPKMLMMASGSRSVSKDFLPVLQKFGIKTLPMPKTLIPMIDKLHGPLNLKMVQNAVKARQGRGESDEKIVKSEEDKIEDKPEKEQSSVAKIEEAKVEEKSNGRLYLGRGKSSKYQDILNKLKSSKK